MHVKNWNRMQNAADLGGIWGYFMNVKNSHACYVHIISLRAHFHKMCNIGMKCVTYWYQIFTCCEELVPIFHGVKFANCKICGSTRPVKDLIRRRTAQSRTSHQCPHMQFIKIDECRSYCRAILFLIVKYIGLWLSL